jgi:glycosyltransferase involved in cell wall biosynthesis
MVEAFCWELPVVAFDIPDLADLPLDCSVKAPPFDAHALGRAMVELVGDAERRRRLGVAAKTFARQFDWDELARRYEVFLEEVSALVPSTGD